MKNAIKREQSQACLSYAERAQFGAKLNTKNIFKALALAMLMPAMMLTTACSSDDDTIINDDTIIINDVNTATKGYAIPVTVNVTRQGDDATTRATYNGTSKKLEFSTGDQLFIWSYNGGSAGQYAGTLTWDGGTTFSGTIITENEYTGTIDALFSGNTRATAVLLPAGYASYGYLSTEGNSGSFKDQYIENKDKAFVTSKITAIEQLSLEYGGYKSGGFALNPNNGILNFTVTGLGASTPVTATLAEGSTTLVSGQVTTDGAGTATFAMALAGGATYVKDLTLTVGGKAITFSDSEVLLEASKIYNITRSVKRIADASAEDVGKVIGADHKIYANAALATAAKTTAVAVIAYMGSDTGEKSPRNHGLALALRDAGNCMWSAEDNDANDTDQNEPFSPEGGMRYNAGRNNDDYPAFKAAITYKACDDDINYWFLPSAYQWKQMINGAGSVDHLRYIANLPSAYYWTSSEYKDDMAWHVETSEGLFYVEYKYLKYYVRACFAF